MDVFFVISGFLITSLIWKDLEGGHFTFARFWERRARRIVPALVAVVAATLSAGWFLMLPADYERLGRSAASQAVFAANVHSWLETGYFAPAAVEEPLFSTPGRWRWRSSFIGSSPSPFSWFSPLSA